MRGSRFGASELLRRAPFAMAADAKDANEFANNPSRGEVERRGSQCQMDSHRTVLRCSKAVGGSGSDIRAVTVLLAVRSFPECTLFRHPLLTWRDAVEVQAPAEAGGKEHR